ncbi:hypothetical protein DF209_17540 [Pectobacterium polaris]|nr:hypothetical protein DF209_17540 [Pectobacterium polaris]
MRFCYGFLSGYFSESDKCEELMYIRLRILCEDKWGREWEIFFFLQQIKNVSVYFTLTFMQHK